MGKEIRSGKQLWLEPQIIEIEVIMTEMVAAQPKYGTGTDGLYQES